MAFYEKEMEEGIIKNCYNNQFKIDEGITVPDAIEATVNELFFECKFNGKLDPEYFEFDEFNKYVRNILVRFTYSQNKSKN